MNIRRFIQDFFGFSPAESRGFLVVVFLLLAVLFVPMALWWWPEKQPNLPPPEKLDALLIEIDKKQPRPRYENHGRFSSKYSPKEAKRFAFNPNEIDAATWQTLGLKPWLAERIIKYRSKGGVFKQKTDLLKIYGFPEELFISLEPFIVLPEQTAVAKVVPTETPKSIEKPTAKLMDLNTADTVALKSIYGIGSKLAARLVAFREKLGGFYTEEQVKEVWGLDSATVLEVMKRTEIKDAQLRKIAVNQVEIIKHPYLKPYVAKAIVAYREQHGAFRSPDDLRPIKLLDAPTFAKIVPYLAFE